MKVHYINILMFALPLNILLTSSLKENIQSSHKRTTPHHTKTYRSLFECELYAPANYDNDPQMKKVMDNFNKKTQQRFHEYEERMKTTRQKCKDQCDKISKKIILKDKLEKELMDKFATLQTDIQSNAIPTCVCEMSIADKVEKGCLKCGEILGTAMPELGSIGGTALYALNAWKDAAIVTVTAAAKEFGATVGKILGDVQGRKIVILGLESLDLKKLGIVKFDSFFNKGYNIDVSSVAKIIATKRQAVCGTLPTLDSATCEQIEIKLGSLLRNGKLGPPVEDAVKPKLEEILRKATSSADALAETTTEEVASLLKAQETALIEGGFNSTISSINAAIIAIIVIILVMVIIYLILRYRRKKKMKKKLQYIKLLEE
ncbi:rifin PIR protein, putative [Plasmodium reichenowi]|uniref:Rifin PIR protein, putative n=1 Tax=Plasmodium reichenowi TaxID=5854 RepID=A0A2P9DCB8_PLARE|nr:rifin PIR protein, putative [Plasmodium reichenowi]